MSVQYGFEDVLIVPADVDPEDLVTQATAARMLDVSGQAILNRLNSGSLTTIWRLRASTSNRVCLRTEVEALAGNGRRYGGSRQLDPPPLSDEEQPDLTGIVFGREKVVCRPARRVRDADVISLSDAAERVGVALSTLLNQVDRGRYTVVWQLGDGVGKSSARLLLRREIEQARRGGRNLRPVNATPPVVSE